MSTIKQIIKQSFKELLSNRQLTVMAGVLLLLAFAFTVYIILTVKPSEVPLVTHYTAFGVAHLYRDQWFYLFLFAVFALIVAIVHIALMIKMYNQKGYQMALLIGWAGVGVLLFAWVIAASIINVWSPI